MTISQAQDLRKRIESEECRVRAEVKALADLRKQLPPEEVKDYSFLSSQEAKAVKLSELFADKDELIVIHNMGAQCPGCTMWADGFNGIFPHVQSRAAFAVISNDDPKTQETVSRKRGWKFDLLSAKGTTFFKDMGFLAEDKPQDPYLPGVSVFRKLAGGKLVRSNKANICPGDEYNGGWHLINLLDGGAKDWHPKITYQ